MKTSLDNLKEAEQKANQLFNAIIHKKLIKAGKTESQLNEEVFAMAKELFGIEKYWHKRIVRSGKNTLRPYNDNPENLTIKEDDILFIDFGPLFDDWEADIGKTYVLGNNPYKLKLKNDVELAWHEIKAWFIQQNELTGAEFYKHIVEVTKQYSWTFGGEIAGHIIGEFPHEKLEPGNYGFYIHPKNSNNMFSPDPNGNKRHWILEIHFIDEKKQIGAFFEQLLC